MILESERAIKFIERLKNPEGTEWAGQPLRLLEWQKEYLRKLLDTKSPGGHTQYEQSLLFIPKKNGKTTFVAAIALYFLFGRKHGQIKCLAQVKEQAALTYMFCRSMIRQDSWMSKRERCKVFKGNQKRIECYYSDSTLEVLSSDAVGANGLNASILIFDEICFSENSELWDAVISGGISRKNLLAIGLSTAGYSTAGWGYQFYERAKAIAAKPSLDPSFLPVIYEAPRDPDWQNIQTYIDCNPTFKEIGEDAIRRIKGMIEAAKKDPAQLRMILRFHLNQWIGADATVPWIPLAKWDEAPTDITLESLAGRVCYAGIDLASVRDLTAKILVFPLDDGRVAVLAKFYLPSDNIADRERTDSGAYYSAWVKDGHVVATPGNTTDYDYLRSDLKRDREKYKVSAVAIDRMYNANQLVTQLGEDGFNVIPIGQGVFTVTPAAKEIEQLVFRQKMIHFGQPVLRWNIANTVAKVLDAAGNVRPTKGKSTGRIDGVFAMINAVSALMLDQAKQRGMGTPGVFFF